MLCKGLVMEMEQMDKPEYMDVVDTVREERLERVRLRQLEWAAQMLCKMEMVDSLVLESERMVCSGWLNSTLLDNCWSTLEERRIMCELLEGGEVIRKGVETGLRNVREGEDSELALLLEEEAQEA